MLTDDELAAMRDTTTAALPDTCTITRAAAATPTFDADTGTYSSGTPTAIYSGACRLRPGNRSDRSDVHGDALIAVDRWTLTLPADADDVAVGDIAAVTVSDDPHVTDRWFRVAVVAPGSWLISRRLTVEEVVDRD